MFDTRKKNRVALAALCALPMASFIASAEVKIEPRPAVVLEEVRGKLPAQYSTLLDIEKVGDSLVAVGDYGHVLISKDGTTWEQIQTPHNAMLNAVAFVDAKTGWAIGHDNTIMRTTDAGKSWKIQFFEPQPSKPFYGLHFDDARNGIVVGSGGRMLVTKDGGSSWTENETFLQDLGMHANNITRLKDGTLVLTGERSIIMRSSDEGENWELVSSPYAGSWFGAIPHGEKGALFYGLRGNIYVTDDVSALKVEDPDDWDEFGVETLTDADELAELGWWKVETNVGASFFNGIPLDDGRTVVVGAAGIALMIDADAKSARLISNPQRLDLGGAAYHRGKLYAVGYSGIHVLQP